MVTIPQGFSYDRITDDRSFSQLPTIRRSHFGFFAECYRWSDDHISVFLPNTTDDPTLTIRSFCQPLHLIRRSQFGFLPTLPMTRRSQIDFFPNANDDPTIKCRFFCRVLPMIRRSIFGFLLNATGNPTIKFWFSGRTLRDLTPWNPKSSYVGGFSKSCWK